MSAPSSSPSASTSQRVGLVGLGSMGRGIAQCLLRAGHELHVWARRPDAAPPLAAQGARVASSLGELGRACGLVVLSVSDAAAVREIVFGGGAGLASTLARDSVIVDTSTLAASDAREIGEQLRKRGIHLLDAPVSGGQQGAEQGTLGCMLGGDAAVLERVRPVLAAFCKTITHVGALGAGQTVKACNQVAVAGVMLGLADAIALARAQGLDLGTMREVLLGGTSRSFVLDQRAPKMFARDFTPGFRARLMRKDLRIALDTARAAGIPLGAARLAAQWLDEMCEAGDGDIDWSAITDRPPPADRGAH